MLLLTRCTGRSSLVVHVVAWRFLLCGYFPFHLTRAFFSFFETCFRWVLRIPMQQCWSFSLSIPLNWWSFIRGFFPRMWFPSSSFSRLLWVYHGFLLLLLLLLHLGICLRLRQVIADSIVQYACNLRRGMFLPWVTSVTIVHVYLLVGRSISQISMVGLLW